MTVDRREFVTGGALAAAALAFGGAPAVAGASRAAARRGALRALATGLAEVPAGRFRNLDGARAVRAYDHWYATADAGLRAHADAVLDGLARLRGHPRALARRPDAAPLVAAGVTLLALVTDPAPDDDARADAPAL